MSVRTFLADYLEHEARWRETRAAQYPEDRRNEESAAALRGVAQYVAGLEEPNYALDRIEAAMGDWPQDSGGSPGLEMTQRFVSRYGFDRGHQMGFDEFLEQLADVIAEDRTRWEEELAEGIAAEWGGGAHLA